MTTNEIRNKFLEFFASKGHKTVESDSLVPKNDPTVLFTTAGMQQFKSQFLGNIGEYTRATTSQKCLRTDDLSEVGKTAFHHTFFEMLGNFSFGDYFKKDAICWAWEFLTKIIEIQEEKLWVSVYKDDKEAKDIWIKTVKIDPKKIVDLGDKSNFWPSEAKTKGPNGPCGPCSEIFFDYGQDVGCKRKDCTPACDCGRFSEIWNLVFTQFERQEDGSLKPLPNKNIDTGMGLERLAAVVQGKNTNFEIDLFQPILNAIDAEAKAAKITLEKKEKYIIADHMRAIVIGISDGVIPSNEGRGYVIKRLITDITDIVLSKEKDSFIHKLVEPTITAMKDPYNDLPKKQNNIIEWVKKTEEAYNKVRKERIPELKIEGVNAKNAEDLGELIFKYRDTYGLTLSAAHAALLSVKISEKNINKTMNNAEEIMNKQREKSRSSSKMTGDVFSSNDINITAPKTEFIGYETDESKARILQLFVNNKSVSSTKKGSEVKIILDKTPFYAESGGQVGDSGEIENDDCAITITQTQRIADVFVHVGIIQSGSIKTGDAVLVKIDKTKRLAIMQNHTATHLLQATLRQVLGDHVQQQGSLVNEKRLRFDFTHPKAVSAQEIIAIENIVNENIRKCIPVSREEMSLASAQKKGALAFFAEKYSDKVSVIIVESVSKELCGGTHLSNTGQIGLLKIINESAIAQGIRRIEAVTAANALDVIHQSEKTLVKIANAFKTSPSEIVNRVEADSKKMKRLEKELAESQIDKIKSSINDIIKASKDVNGIKLIYAVFENFNTDTLRRIADLIKQKNKSGIIALGSKEEKNASVIVCVSDDLIKKGIAANIIIKQVAEDIGGSGGGRPQMAQAGSKQAVHLEKALKRIEEYIKGNIT